MYQDRLAVLDANRGGILSMPATLAMEQMQLISEEIFPAVRSAG